MKYRVPGELVRPFLSAGLSYRRLARFKAALGSGRLVRHGVGDGSAAGIDRKTASGQRSAGDWSCRCPVRICSEMRYTRWGSSSFRSALGGLASQLNQADFLLGIMF